MLDRARPSDNYGRLQNTFETCRVQNVGVGFGVLIDSLPTRSRVEFIPVAQFDRVSVHARFGRAFSRNPLGRPLRPVRRVYIKSLPTDRRNATTGDVRVH